MQVGAEEELLLAGQNVVNLDDAGVERLGSRRGKDIARIVDTIADGVQDAVELARAHRTVVGEHIGVWTARDIGGTTGIQRSHLRSTQPVCVAVYILVAKFSAVKLLRGQDAGRDFVDGLTLPLVVEEEEPVLLDGSTDGAAKGVHDVFLGDVRLTQIQLGEFVEPLIGHGIGGAIVLVRRAVILIRATLGDERDLRPGAAA